MSFFLLGLLTSWLLPLSTLLRACSTCSARTYTNKKTLPRAVLSMGLHKFVHPGLPRDDSLSLSFFLSLSPPFPPTPSLSLSLSLARARALSRCRMLGRECPEAVLPDRALYLPTFSHLLIVKLLSLPRLQALSPLALLAPMPAAALAYTVQPVALLRASPSVCRLAATSALTWAYTGLLSCSLALSRGCCRTIYCDAVADPQPGLVLGMLVQMAPRNMFRVAPMEWFLVY